MRQFTKLFSIILSICFFNIATTLLSPSVQAQTSIEGPNYSVGVLDEYFYRAKNNWLALDNEYTAVEIKKARAFVKVVLNLSGQQEDISPLIEIFENLESNLKEGKVERLNSMRAVFAHAHARFARYNQVAAELLWKEGHKAAAAQSLRHGYHHLANAALWSGYGLKAESLATEWRINRKYLEYILKVSEIEGAISNAPMTKAIVFLRETSSLIQEEIAPLVKPFTNNNDSN